MGFASRARLLLLLVACLHATAPSPATAHPADGAAEKDGGAGSLPKTRLSMQGAVEVGQCLVAAADAGCGAFACLENTTCDGPGLQALCAELVRHADMYDVQGKSFIKEALKCMAQGLRGRFNCNQRKCSALSELSLQLQRECYHRHELCAAARPNAEAMALSVPPPTALPKGPYLELLRALFSCDNATSAAVRRALSARLGKAHASALAQMLGGSAPRRQHPGKPAPGECHVTRSRAPPRGRGRRTEADPTELPLSPSR
ncbi:stanniocalcin-like [Lampetra planeri]